MAGALEMVHLEGMREHEWQAGQRIQAETREGLQEAGHFSSLHPLLATVNSIIHGAIDASVVSPLAGLGRGSGRGHDWQHQPLVPNAFNCARPAKVF